MIFTQKTLHSSFRESPGEQTLQEWEAGKGRRVYCSVDRSHGYTRVTFKPQEALGILQDKASSGHHAKNILLIPPGDKCLLSAL